MPPMQGGLDLFPELRIPITLIADPALVQQGEQHLLIALVKQIEINQCFLCAGIADGQNEIINTEDGTIIQGIALCRAQLTREGDGSDTANDDYNCSTNTHSYTSQTQQARQNCCENHQRLISNVECPTNKYGRHQAQQ